MLKHRMFGLAIPRPNHAVCAVLFLLPGLDALGEEISSAAAASPPDGYVALFNGKDLSGWCGRGQIDPDKFRMLADDEKAARQKAENADLLQHWRIDGGELVNDGSGVFCTTEREFKNFELLIDWKMVALHTDSGIYLRGCPQVQIWNPNDPAQAVYGAELGSGGLWNNNPGTAGKDPLVKADRPLGEWNQMKIRMEGDRVTVDLNDKTVVDNAVMHNFWNREQPLPSLGPIQLQTHDGEMRFRNIFVRELP